MSTRFYVHLAGFPAPARTTVCLPRAVEFHVSRAVREQYGLDDALFGTSGRVVFANFTAARIFAERINAGGETALQPSDLNALGLIDELLHHAIDRYRNEVYPAVMGDALGWLEAQIGTDDVARTLEAFVALFPPVAVYRDGMAPAVYLAGSTDGVPNRELALEELLILWLANQNPAFAPFRMLFDDTPLRDVSAYPQVITALTTFLEQATPMVVHRPGPDDGTPAQPQPAVSLLDVLQETARQAPHSLHDQLDYLREDWGVELTEIQTHRTEQGGNFMAEESHAAETAFLRHQHEQAWGTWHDDGGHAPAEAPVYQDVPPEEPEQFSEDLDWMPSVVMIAKSTLVWLAQLSETYGQPVTRLDEIPDAELDRLAGFGFNALWLIGVWERSTASQTIKQRMGNPEAAASAYALFDYTIAENLGGVPAYEDLRDRCTERGMRLASDMVPNHTGLDSAWVREHPEWFISLPYPPYPSYTFSSTNLSTNPRYGIYLEDHYYDHSDAAVVFKRVDFKAKDTRYIYHGNDGTGLPWNDTAQLDYLKAEVREAIIQTILRVAHQFPIIRFDAAMVLVKRHLRRLWYPAYGTRDSVPSRAEFSMPQTMFDQWVPEEFWREVVDRVAEEAPDTLLLAEAFWMLEGYFVRTLGMHRVYNSAFMHMLRDEENAKYRDVIANTLQFDPEILKMDLKACVTGFK